MNLTSLFCNCIRLDSLPLCGYPIPVLFLFVLMHMDGWIRIGGCYFWCRPIMKFMSFLCPKLRTYNKQLKYVLWPIAGMDIASCWLCALLLVSCSFGVCPCEVSFNHTANLIVYSKRFHHWKFSSPCFPIVFWSRMTFVQNFMPLDVTLPDQVDLTSCMLFPNLKIQIKMDQNDLGFIIVSEM